MIRRIAGRVRRAIAARLVPRRDRLRDSLIRTTHSRSLVELARTMPTVLVIVGELASAAWRRLQRALHSAPKPLRIGIDIRPFYEPLTGVGWYLFNLVDQFSRRSDVELVPFGDPVVTDEGPRLFVSLPSRMTPVVFDLRGKAVSRFTRRLGSYAFVPLAALNDCDLFFGANFFLPRTMSAVARRRVITIHDLTYRRFPELVQDETLANLEGNMLREITRTDAVICVSEATRQDVLREYEADPAKVVTIHSGIGVTGAAADRPSFLPRKYLLFVSTVEPRKNLDVLVSAFERLRDERGYDGDLVVAGKIGWKAENIVSRMNGSRWRQHIHHVDYLNRDQLMAAYGAADIFVLPSLYEGFGFPILEAMAAGVPVIAARSSSLPEIGGDAALYFDPRNGDELVALVRKIGADPALRNRMVTSGRARAAEFRWEKTADQTLALFRRVAAE